MFGRITGTSSSACSGAGPRHVVLFAIGLTVAANSSALASPVDPGFSEARPLQDGNRSLVVVVDSDLRELIQEFGERAGLRVVLSEGVSGRVQDARLSLDPDLFLDQLARTHGLDFFREGDKLFVSRLDEAVTRVIALRGFSFEALKSQLAQLGIEPQAASIRAGTSGLAIISGPPRYVAMVELVAESLATPAASSGPPAASTQGPRSRIALYRGGVREDYVVGGAK